MSDSAPPFLSTAPLVGTAALWARMFPVVDDTVTDRSVFRPAAHWIGQWGPHWPLGWDTVLDWETFEDALRRAMAAAKEAEAVGNG